MKQPQYKNCRNALKITQYFKNQIQLIISQWYLMEYRFNCPG